MSSSLFSMNSVLDFIEKCNKANQAISDSLEKIAKIILLDEMEAWKRTKIYFFFNQTLEFFKNRTDFIITCIKIKNLNKEILEAILRGLIEIYCRILFLANSSDEEKLKKIIWHDLYTCALSDIETTSNPDLSALISIDYKILQDINVSLPTLQNLRQMVQDSLEEIPIAQDLRNLIRDYSFPPVKRIIVDYLDENEEPIISKYQLYKQYSLLSEQIHSSVYSEYVIHDSQDTSKYRVVAFLVPIYLKFLREIAKNAKMENDIEELIQEFNKFKIHYSRLWGFSKQL